MWAEGKLEASKKYENGHQTQRRTLRLLDLIGPVGRFGEKYYSHVQAKAFMDFDKFWSRTKHCTVHTRIPLLEGDNFCWNGDIFLVSERPKSCVWAVFFLFFFIIRIEWLQKKFCSDQIVLFVIKQVAKILIVCQWNKKYIIDHMHNDNEPVGEGLVEVARLPG